MSGPYRTRSELPERFESYWRLIELRHKRKHQIWLVLMGLAVLPALVVLSTVALGRASPHAPATLEKALGEPWGLVISPSRSEPFVGTRPVGANPPDAAASPIPAAELQRLLGAHADGFRKCYVPALSGFPTGDLIVSIAVRDEKIVTLVTGKASLRAPLGRCLQHEVESVQFPPTHGEVTWIHFPFRFASW